MERTPVANQGEIRIDKISILETGLAFVGENRFIVSHSESGNNHVLEGDYQIFEKKRNVPAGMKILIAIVNNPSTLFQEAAEVPHEPVRLEPGFYEFRIKRQLDIRSGLFRRVID